MEKVDFTKDQRQLYRPPERDFQLVTVPPMWFLQADGLGDPNTSQLYAQAVEALCAASYAVKRASRKTYQRDYVVAPLEGLWWAEDMTAFTRGATSEWSWTMMIRQPDWVNSDAVAAVVEDTARKKDLPGLAWLRHASLEEGLCVQILHTGPYSNEGPTLARLKDGFLPANQLEPAGPHHEIYLSDARKVEPSKLKTILRQPVRRLS